MTQIQVNQIKRNAIRRKSVENKINRTRKTHRRAILIRPTTVITDANKKEEKRSENGSDQIMRTFNGKVADDSI